MGQVPTGQSGGGAWRCTPQPAYHDGASSLGPQGPQHLPLHKEVGEKDDRGDLSDGSHHKGPLWKETWKSNLMPGLGMVAPLSFLGNDSWEPPLSPSFVLGHNEDDGSVLRHSSALLCLE